MQADPRYRNAVTIGLCGEEHHHTYFNAGRERSNNIRYEKCHSIRVPVTETTYRQMQLVLDDNRAVSHTARKWSRKRVAKSGNPRPVMMMQGRESKNWSVTFHNKTYSVLEESFENAVLFDNEDELGVRFHSHVVDHAVSNGQRVLRREVNPVSCILTRIEQSREKSVCCSYLPVTYPFGVAVMPRASRGTRRSAMQSRMQSSHSRWVSNIYA